MKGAILEKATFVMLFTAIHIGKDKLYIGTGIMLVADDSDWKRSWDDVLWLWW